MTQDERNICKMLGTVTCLGGFDKRFMRNVSAFAESKPEEELSEKQREWIFRLLYKYRRQLPNTYKLFQQHPHCRPKPKPCLHSLPQ